MRHPGPNEEDEKLILFVAGATKMPKTSGPTLPSQLKPGENSRPVDPKPIWNKCHRCLFRNGPRFGTSVIDACSETGPKRNKCR